VDSANDYFFLHRGGQLCHSKIDNFQLPCLWVNENIIRLEVPMHQVVLMHAPARREQHVHEVLDLTFIENTDTHPTIDDFLQGGGTWHGLADDIQVPLILILLEYVE